MAIVFVMFYFITVFFRILTLYCYIIDLALFIYSFYLYTTTTNSPTFLPTSSNASFPSLISLPYLSNPLPNSLSISTKPLSHKIISSSALSLFLYIRYLNNCTFPHSLLANYGMFSFVFFTSASSSYICIVLALFLFNKPLSYAVLSIHDCSLTITTITSLNSNGFNRLFLLIDGNDDNNDPILNFFYDCILFSFRYYKSNSFINLSDVFY
jgi:hypothetical protein